MDLEELKRKADSGKCFAQTILGSYYLFGHEEVVIDYQKAFELLSKAADQGAATAVANLGFMYANGLGIDRDVARAISLLEQVGTVRFNAALELARIYSKGLEVPVDEKKAFEWYSILLVERDDGSEMDEDVQEAERYVAWYRGSR